MRKLFLLLLLFLGYAHSVQNFEDVVDQKFEKRVMTAFTFHSPFLLIRGNLPFWTFGGASVVTEQYLRLTPDQKSTKGFVWGQKAVDFSSWEVVLDLSISGSTNMGADGMAFWYIDHESPVTGQTFGGPQSWTGLAVIFDTFDNDAKGENPSVSIVVNDGTWKFNMDDDGATKVLGTCKQFFRNIPFSAKIQYYDSQLFVFLKLSKQGNWIPCAQAPVDLPTGYFFAVTAATGGVSDNHDITSFVTNRLVPIGKPDDYRPHRRRANNIQEQQGAAEKKPTLVDRLNEVKSTDLPQPTPISTPNSPQQPVNPSPPSPPPLPYNTPQSPSDGSIQGEIRRLNEQYQILSQNLDFLKQQLLYFQAKESRNAESFHRIFDQQTTFAEALEKIKTGTNEQSPQRIDSLSTLTHEVQQLIGNNMDEKMKETNNLVMELHRILNVAKGTAVSAKADQELISRDVEVQRQVLAQSAERGGIGSWIYIIGIQLIGGFGFMYWRKLQDDKSNKKYY